MNPHPFRVVNNEGAFFHEPWLTKGEESWRYDQVPNKILRELAEAIRYRHFDEVAEDQELQGLIGFLVYAVLSLKD